MKNNKSKALVGHVGKGAMVGKDVNGNVNINMNKETRNK